MLYSRINHDKFKLPKSLLSLLSLLFLTLIQHSVPLYSPSPLFILTCSCLLKGIVFLAQKKKIWRLFTVIISSNCQEPSFAD